MSQASSAGRAEGARRGWPHPRRLYAAALPEHEAPLELDGEAHRHAQVLRLRSGDDLELFDAAGHIARARLVDMNAKRARCLVEPRRHVPRPAPALHVVLGLPKGDKLDTTVRMLTELGAESIHIAQTERTVPRPADRDARLARLVRITREACAQSGQAYAPTVHSPAGLAEIAARAPAGATKWVLWEESATPRPRAGELPPDQMWVVVGPEGGLAPAEVAMLRGHGFVELSIGPAILRFDTAVITAAALALDQLGRLR